MRRACRGTAPRTSGRHPEPDPELSPRRPPASRLRTVRPSIRRPFGPGHPGAKGETQREGCRRAGGECVGLHRSARRLGTGGHDAGAGHLGGGPTNSLRSSGSWTSWIEAVLGRFSWLANPGSARLACSRELAARAEARGHLGLGDRHPNSSAICRSRSSSMPSTSTSRAWTNGVSGCWPTTFERSSATSSRRFGRSLAAVMWRPTTSAIAPIALFARWSSTSRRRGHSCSSSTTFTGRTRHRSSCLARSCAARRPQRPCHGPGPAARQGAGTSLGGARPSASVGGRPYRTRRLTLAEASGSWAARLAPPEATVLYEESGGNPFYLEQLARSLDRAGPIAPRFPPSSH